MLIDGCGLATSFKSGHRNCDGHHRPQFGLQQIESIQSIFDALEDLFGIDIQGTWVIRFVRQMLEPLMVLSLLCGWLSTSMTQIQPSEQGVRSHFGTPEPTVLEGGLH